jgi:glycosyltransferase involved in cell wall biosynthesis
VRTRWPWTIARARRALQAVLARRAVDVAICHSAWAQAIFAPVVREAGLPQVFWLHDVARGRHWLERWARLTPPDVIICNSAFTARSAASIYPGVETHVVHPPLRVGGRDDARRADIRRRLGAGPEVAVIVQVARLERLKGHDLHLEALAMLKDIAPRWQCWMVGGVQRPHEARYLAALERQAADLGIAERVRFLGQRGDVSAILGAADIACQPNTQPDAFGISFVEALGAGLPVVTTAMGGALEVLGDSFGFLVPPADAAALAAMLRRLVTDPALRATVGAAGPARARQLCDPAAQMRRLDSVLASLLPPRRIEASA